MFVGFELYSNPNLRNLTPKPNYYNFADLDRPTQNATYTELNQATGLTIDMEVSRLAIGFQKVCIIRLPQCTNATLNFALRIAHLLAAFIQTGFSQVW